MTEEPRLATRAESSKRIGCRSISRNEATASTYLQPKDLISMSAMLAITAALLICFAANLRAEEAAVSYYNRGNKNYNKRDLIAAVADYTRAIEANPKYKQAYYKRGPIRDLQGDRSGAIDDYTRAIELDPKYEPPRLQTRI